MLRAGVKTIAGVIITHEHNDHTAGLDDLRPFGFAQRMDIPVYCLPRVAADLRRRYAYVFTDYPGVPRLDIREVNFGDRIRCGSHNILLLEILHGQLPIFGVRCGDLLYLTDVKEIPARTLVRCKGAKRVVISALHHRGTHSHLALSEALEYLRQIGPDRGYLTHLSHRMGRYAVLQNELPDFVRVGYDNLEI